MASVLNKSEFKKFLLRTAVEQGKVLYGGKPKFESVSSATLALAERVLREWAAAHVAATPSKGKRL